MSVLSEEERLERIQQLTAVLSLIREGAMPMDEWHRFVDSVEELLLRTEQNEMKTEHTIIDGMYLRRVFMPEGSMVVSNIHNTQHPYVVLKGKVLVRTNLGIRLIVSPCRGITQIGTRRILLMLSDTIWETFHVTNLKSVTEIMDAILDDRKNPLLNDDQMKKLNRFRKRTNLLKS